MILYNDIATLPNGRKAYLAAMLATTAGSLQQKLTKQYGASAPYKIK